ncbi:MAG: MFS transporter [Candidatus Hodarchaeales archaeon]
MRSFKDIPRESSQSDDYTNKEPVETDFNKLYPIEAGKVLGDSIIRTYAQIYAVFIASSPILLSLMTSIRNLLQLATQSFFGKHSDKYGRKPFLLTGLFISAVISFIFPMITNPLLFLLAVIIYSIAFSIFSPAWIAYLGDISTSGYRGSFLGKISTIGVLSTFIILLIMGWGIALIEEDYGLQYAIIFRIGTLAFLISGIASIFLSERIGKNGAFSEGSDGEEKELLVKIPLKLRFKSWINEATTPLRENPTFRRFVIICAFMDFSMSIGWPIFGFIRERYASPSENSLMWAVFMGFQVISLTIGGKTIDRWGHKVGFWGRKFMFLIPLVLFFARNWYELAIANMIGGIGYGLYYVAMTAYIIDSAPEHSKGNYIGAFSLIMGLSTFLGSISMGIATEILINFVGKWDAIYSMLLVVIIFRFVGGLNFYFVKEPIEYTE